MVSLGPAFRCFLAGCLWVGVSHKAIIKLLSGVTVIWRLNLGRTYFQVHTSGCSQSSENPLSSPFTWLWQSSPSHCLPGISSCHGGFYLGKLTTWQLAFAQNEATRETEQDTGQPLCNIISEVASITSELLFIWRISLNERGIHVGVTLAGKSFCVHLRGFLLQWFKRK